MMQHSLIKPILRQNPQEKQGNDQVCEAGMIIARKDKFLKGNFRRRIGSRARWIQVGE
jgi:hypothetical protein